MFLNVTYLLKHISEWHIVLPWNINGTYLGKTQCQARTFQNGTYFWTAHCANLKTCFRTTHISEQKTKPTQNMLQNGTYLWTASKNHTSFQLYNNCKGVLPTSTFSNELLHKDYNTVILWLWLFWGRVLRMNEIKPSIFLRGAKLIKSTVNKKPFIS